MKPFCFAGKGDEQALSTWLDDGGGVDTRHESVTLLIVAAGERQEAMVRLLLQRGASVNLQDSEGGTALMAAALTGHTSIVQALLDARPVPGFFSSSP